MSRWSRWLLTLGLAVTQVTPLIHTVEAASALAPQAGAPVNGIGPTAAWAAKHSGTAGSLAGVDCTTASLCVAVGDRGVILTSSDAGNTWTTQNSGTTDALTAVSCPTSSQCVVVGDGGMVLTSQDGGATWNSQGSVTNEVLLAVDCPTTGLCVTVGSGGMVLTSSDGGATWFSQQAGTTDTLQGVDCPSATQCVAVSAQGGVLTSGDGGNTWSSWQSGTGDSLNAVECPNTSRCIAVSAQGSILTSDNGGSNWSKRHSGTSRSLNAIRCQSPSTCVIVGDGGIILGSQDDGTNWMGQHSATTNDLEGSDCVNLGFCVVVGASGTILVARQPGSLVWNTSTTALPTALAFAAGVTGQDGRIYIFGGVDNNSNDLSTTYIYNPATNSWAKGASMPRATQGARAVLLPNGSIAVLGGGRGCSDTDCSDGTVYNGVPVYSPKTNRWSWFTPMHSPRYLLAAALFQGKLYAIGGSSSGALASAEVYDFASTRWSWAASLPSPCTAIEAVVDSTSTSMAVECDQSTYVIEDLAYESTYPLDLLYANPSALYPYMDPSTGAYDEDRDWASGKSSVWYVELQRASEDAISAGINTRDAKAIEDGFKIFDWAFSHQGPDGGFTTTSDAFHCTAFFTEAVAHSMLLLKADPVYSQIYQAQIARYTTLAHAAARWMVSPAVWQAGLQADSWKGTNPYTHRRYLNAAALGLTGLLTGDQDLISHSRFEIEQGLALQWPNGVNPEGGG